jgi:hypothetical protein
LWLVCPSPGSLRATNEQAFCFLNLDVFEKKLQKNVKKYLKKQQKEKKLWACECASSRRGREIFLIKKKCDHTSAGKEVEEG